MYRVILETETQAIAKSLAAFLKNLKNVKSVTLEKESKGEYNWINPSRPATEEEIEQMLAEGDAEYKSGMFSTSDTALKESSEIIRQWKKKK